MTTNQHNEASYENTLIALFQELRDALRRQNPMLSEEVLQEAFRLVTHVNEGTLEQRNEQLMDYVQNGVEVKYSEDDAYLQIKQYQQKCPSLFVYNAFSVISDHLTSKAGTITAKEDRYMSPSTTITMAILFGILLTFVYFCTLN